MTKVAMIPPIVEILHPFAAEKIKKACAPQTQFAYYTTADVAMSVLKYKSVWMRNAAAMNDYREIEYGLERLDRVREGPLWSRLANALNNVHSGLFEAAVEQFERFRPKLLSDTYITCVSLHDAEERDYGRLSMWRAYGGRNGVALIISGAAILESQGSLAAYTSPVEYFDEQMYERAFERVVTNIEREIKFLSTLPRLDLQNRLFEVLLFAALCVKHPGFKEEQEWRIFSITGSLKGRPLQSDVEVVRGTPQHVTKIPLGRSPNNPLAKRPLGEIVQQVLIGPSDFPDMSKRAFAALLGSAGVPNADSRVHVSGIPLRHF